jgi:short-subunit dehydrogenase
VLVKDLVAPDACKDIYNELSEDGITVDYLMNNAGFGGQGVFHELRSCSHTAGVVGCA